MVSFTQVQPYSTNRRPSGANVFKESKRSYVGIYITLVFVDLTHTSIVLMRKSQTKQLYVYYQYEERDVAQR